MKLDYTFELYFELNARSMVIDALKVLYDEESAQALEKATHERESSFDLLFRVPFGEAFTEYVEWTPQTLTDDGFVLLGSIVTWIAPEEHPDLEQTMLEVRLWPAATLLQRACFGSQYIRDTIISILETCQGVTGCIDDANGRLTQFWSRADGRERDDYPLGRLL